MTKTDLASPGTIESATTTLRRAERELAEAFAQRERLQAKLRLVQTDVSHEEANAGAAIDRVLAGEQKDALREQAMLADARAALDAVQQGGNRIEQQITDARAAIAQAQRGVLLATADEALRATLDAAPALVEAVDALGRAFHAVTDAHATAINAIARLQPGRPLMLPDLDLARFLGAAIWAQGINITLFQRDQASASFDLEQPIAAVVRNITGHIDDVRSREAA